MTAQEIFQAILNKRGIKDPEAFLNPKYEKQHDGRLLPDINPAIKRIKEALNKKHKVVIYGDYDIDGLTATTILHEALTKFGIETDCYMPDRFTEGYGLSKIGIDAIKKKQADLIITVDCGSRSLDEIEYANKHGIDVIVTDHHELGDKLPDAIAVINPKREDSKYPWRDLAGVGVAFKLITVLQQELDGLDVGQEKWLLDLVALGTVCDVVDLLDENRTFVWWGLKVMAKTRRPGLQALADVSAVDIEQVTAEDLGYRFGPRLNAAGRLEHARLSLELLMTDKTEEAQNIALKLDKLNQQRRSDQQKIFEEASRQAEKYSDDPVLILADKDWSHGINGIVASSLMEKYKKPVFVLQIMGDTTKGSGRSFGDFHLADAVKAADEVVVKGGGHKYAAGVTIKTKDVGKFRKIVNDNYHQQELAEQHAHLLPQPDVELDIFSAISLELIEMLEQMAPFGNKNLSPIFTSKGVKLDTWRPVGSTLAHAKSTFSDKAGYKLDGIGFSLADKMPEPGVLVDVVYSPQKNQYNGRTTVQIQVLTIRVA